MDVSAQMRAEAQAKQTNSPNDWTTAGNMWLSAAKFGMNDMGKMRPGTEQDAITMAKRAAACFTRSYKDSPQDTVQHSGIEYDSRLRQLRNCYDLLASLEPSNGLWYYLVGEQYAAVGHYMEAHSNLEMAVRLSGSQPAGQKAQQLLAHIASFYKKDQEAMTRDAPRGLGNILQNQTGGNTQQTLYRMQAADDAIHGRMSHTGADSYRSDGNKGE